VSAALAGRTAIVTGGTSGIGFGIAARLLADGANVVIGALSEEGLKKATEALRARGHEPAGYVGNLARPGEAEGLLAAAVGAYGGVDVLVNNAGGGVIRATLEHTEETLRARSTTTCGRRSTLLARCCRTWWRAGAAGSLISAPSRCATA
jgi:2,3-dihydroxy-2,3-dihydro-p-cumate dehydrogenase